MLRVIFDTNVFGRLLQEPDIELLKERIVNDPGFVVYGYQPIRKEIRDVPKTTKLSRHVRIMLLNLYDLLSKQRFLHHSEQISELALQYYADYKRFGGLYNWDTSLKADFTIVACASFYGLDIIYSADTKTLMSKKACLAYDMVNIKENLRTPRFLSYELLLKKLRRMLWLLKLINPRCYFNKFS